MRRLLSHLAASGFDGAPAPLPPDEDGRDVFTFIDGYVPADLTFHEDDVLRSAARLIRRFHDAAAEMPEIQTATAHAETVCHNDLSPCNFVFRAGDPVALIDFDAAAPGVRVDDFGYAAWLWLDLGAPSIEALEQRRRLALFVDAYGIDLDVAAVLAAVMQRQARLLARAKDLGNDPMRCWAADCLDWTKRHHETLGVV